MLHYTVNGTMRQISESLYRIGHYSCGTRANAALPPFFGVLASFCGTLAESLIQKTNM